MKNDYQVIATNTDLSILLDMVQFKVRTKVKAKLKTHIGKLFELYNGALFINTMHMK